jgi:hypothetical protein
VTSCRPAIFDDFISHSMKYLYLVYFLFFAAGVRSQNLLVNPGAESGDPASVGWTSVSVGSAGASCYNNSGWRIIQSLNAFPTAQHGSYFFMPAAAVPQGPRLKSDRMAMYPQMHP